jgi:hypothetical protein
MMAVPTGEKTITAAITIAKDATTAAFDFLMETSGPHRVRSI